MPRACSATCNAATPGRPTLAAGGAKTRAARTSRSAANLGRQVGMIPFVVGGASRALMGRPAYPVLTTGTATGLHLLSPLGTSTLGTVELSTTEYAVLGLL